MDDAALVRAACDGDKTAFAAIYDRYSDRLYSFLCSVVRNRDEAADLLQDTFLTAASRLHQLRDPSRLRPWLYAIARHLAMKSFSRAKNLDPLQDEVEIADSAPGPEELAARGELAALIDAAAQGLGTQDRVVLDLHLRQGLEGQELGEALGVTASHAYVLLSRMRDQVERSLGALLVARQGSEDCGELRSILRAWDGSFTTVWRKRVARHVDKCEVCGALRKRVLSPISMMGAIPMLPAPAEARAAVLEQLDLVGLAGRLTGTAAGVSRERWPARYGGFPPPMLPRRRRVFAAAIAAAVLLAMLTGPTVTGLADESLAADHPLEFNAGVLRWDVLLEFPDVAAPRPPTPDPVRPTARPTSTPLPSVSPTARPSPTTPSRSPIVSPTARPTPTSTATDSTGTPGRDSTGSGGDSSDGVAGVDGGREDSESRSPQVDDEPSRDTHSIF